MTVSTTTSKASYSGNGSITVFAYTFKVFDEDDLTVILRDNTTGTETIQSITTNYTVSGVGNAGGGNVTFVAAPASGKTVVVRRESDQTQTTDYTPNDPFPAEAHEDALDKLTFIAQEVQEELNRAIKISRTNTMTSTEFTVGSTTRANKVLAFDSSGEIAVTQEIGTFVGNWSSGTDFNQRDLVKDTSTNNIFIANTAHTSSGSQPLTTNTDSAKWDLIVDAASATTSATAAAASATAAANSATQATTNGAAQVTLATAQVALATTQANNAATSATTATTQASNASTSATAAAASAAAAALSADTFDDTYLGSKSSDPTVDNDGDPLNAGDLYFNTTSNELKVYNGSAWQTAAISATGLLTAANNLSDLASAATAQTNLGGTTVGKALFTAASVSAAQQAVDLEVGVDVQAFDADTAKLDVAQTFTAAQRGSTDTDTTNTGSVTLDFAVNQNFVLTLTGNVTLANPTTETVGQSGFIVFIQDSTGGRTISLGTDYETAGAAGLTLSTAASTTDIVPYVVAATGRILLGTPQLAFA